MTNKIEKNNDDFLFTEIEKSLEIIKNFFKNDEKLIVTFLCIQNKLILSFDNLLLKHNNKIIGLSRKRERYLFYIHFDNNFYFIKFLGGEKIKFDINQFEILLNECEKVKKRIEQNPDSLMIKNSASESTHKSNKKTVDLKGEKMFCLDGTSVFVRNHEKDESKIIVNYEGSEYIRDRSIIGKTLFHAKTTNQVVKTQTEDIKDKTVHPTNQISQKTLPIINQDSKQTVHKKSFVKSKAKSTNKRKNLNKVIILFDFSNNEKLAVYLDESYVDFEYRGMGGAYYGARVDKTYKSRAGQILDNEIYVISDRSPLGMELLDKDVGDTFDFYPTDGCCVQYKVVEIMDYEN